MKKAMNQSKRISILNTISVLVLMLTLLLVFLNISYSSRLSKAVLKQFCKATGTKNRGVMYTDTMSGINWSKVPVTIMEMGFLSNQTEDKKMNKSKTYQKKMTKGMADGIDVYFKRG